MSFFTTSASASQQQITPSEPSELFFQKTKTTRSYPLGSNNENFFSDDQILNIHGVACRSTYPIEIESKLGLSIQKTSNFSVEYFSNATCIFTQQFITTGAITCAGILLFEKGYKKSSPKFYQELLTNRKFETIDQLLEFLKPKGIDCESFNLLDQHKNFSILQSRVKDHGPIILYLKKENKYVILDAIEDSKVTLRDPYHGWKLDISKDTFLYQLPSKCLVIKSIPKEDTSSHLFKA